MTIANVTTSTAITAAWGNSVADALNLEIGSAARLDRGTVAVETITQTIDTAAAFATGTTFRVPGTDTTASRPAWASGAGYYDVTSTIRYTTDANPAVLFGGIAYRVNATGTWLYLSENVSDVISLPASTAGQCTTRYIFTVSGPTDYLQVAVAGRQSSGSGSVTINVSSILVQASWETTS